MTVHHFKYAFSRNLTESLYVQSSSLRVEILISVSTEYFGNNHHRGVHAQRNGGLQHWPIVAFVIGSARLEFVWCIELAGHESVIYFFFICIQVTWI